MIRNKEIQTCEYRPNGNLLEWPNTLGYGKKTRNRVIEECEILEDVANEIQITDTNNDTHTPCKLGVSAEITCYLDFPDHKFYVSPVTAGYLVEFYDSYGIPRWPLLKKSVSDIYVLCQEIEAAKRMKRAA